MEIDVKQKNILGESMQADNNNDGVWNGTVLDVAHSPKGQSFIIQVYQADLWTFTPRETHLVKTFLLASLKFDLDCVDVGQHILWTPSKLDDEDRGEAH